MEHQQETFYPQYFLFFSIMPRIFHVNYVRRRGFGAIRFTEPSVYSKDCLDVHSNANLFCERLKWQKYISETIYWYSQNESCSCSCQILFVIMGEDHLTLGESYKPCDNNMLQATRENFLLFLRRASSAGTADSLLHLLHT